MSQQNTTTSRRALLAGAPAAAAGALAAGTVANAVALGTARAAEVDPMLAAVEQYKATVQARATVLDAEQDYETYKTEREWEKAQKEAFGAGWDAFYEMLDTTPTTIAGIALVLEVLGTDPYNEGSMSSAAWAYNNSGGGDECPVDRLMLAMAAALRGQS
jgi:hypothetical protein